MAKTQADECLEVAKKNIRLAIEELFSIVVERTSGTNDFTEGYLNEIKKSFYELIEIRDRLD